MILSKDNKLKSKEEDKRGLKSAITFKSVVEHLTGQCLLTPSDFISSVVFFDFLKKEVHKENYCHEVSY